VPEDLRVALELENIEARPLWKPLHRQPVFAMHETVGAELADALFARGLCLPSGSGMADVDLERVIGAVRRVFGRAPARRRPITLKRPMHEVKLA
jgi:pyridoxal phosphate-dependent aminotransferase EpsN